MILASSTRMKKNFAIYVVRLPLLGFLAFARQTMLV